jgi:transposase, IS30 family
MHGYFQASVCKAFISVFIPVLHKVAARIVPEQWEGYLNRNAVGTLVERKSRYLIMTKLRDCSAEATLEAFTRKFRHVPPGVRKTLTYDQGKEMARHETLVKRLKTA